MGVVRLDVYCMSADVAGPIRVEGRDPESREDYEDSLYQPSGGEEEDEHEHGHGVRAAKVEEEHP